jgi:predicted transcriptional regulator YheO
MEEFANLSKIIEMIAAQMGSDCEVVLHDISRGFENSIVKICNGHVTNRKEGGCGTNFGLEKLMGSPSEDQYSYISQMQNGHLLKSSTMYLRDDQGEIIGAICINLDITEFVAAIHTINKFAGFNYGSPQKDTQGDEIFVNNVGELINHFINEWQGILGKPAATMTRDEKIRAVEFFDSKGVFLITRAGDRISEFLHVSKFTLYQYLEAARKNCERPADAPKIPIPD